MTVNTKIIKALNPCQYRFDNWLEHYKDFDDDILVFLNLPNITAKDKIWVCVRILPRHLVEVFAIDCAFAAAAAERERQLDALAWLILEGE